MGGGSFPFKEKGGGECMTVFETIFLMISFASLIVAILSFHQKIITLSPSKRLG